MTTFLINENKPTPLTEALAASGVHLLHKLWLPDDRVLANVSGCFVSFYDCLTKPVKMWRLKRRLARHRIPLIAWNRDAPSYLNRQAWRLDMLDRAQLLDIYLSHAFPDRRRFAKTALLLHNAARSETYNLGATTLATLRNPEHYLHDVAFVGVIHARQIKDYLPRERFFTELRNRLDERGISHCFIDSQEKTLTPAEQVELIQRSRINLNYGAGCEPPGSAGWGLPERCFGIPACGGFLLSDRRAHAADAFAPGHEWADFDGIDDAVTQISHHLAHFAAARDIADAAHARVMNSHTYRHRAAELLSAVEHWRKATP
jgi:spore maturation protein CgeB